MCGGFFVFLGEGWEVAAPKGSQGAQPPAPDNIVTDSVYIHILHAISIVPFIPFPALGAKIISNGSVSGA